MTRSGVHLKRNMVRKLVVIFLIFMVPSAVAIELPSFKYGSLKRDPEVTRIFEAYEILPNYKYYYNGRGNIPYAIIGIDEGFKLRQGLWKEIELTTQLLRGWIYQMDTIYGYRPYGSKILDHTGKQLGIWYSSKQWTTVIMEDNNEVAVFAPEPPGFRSGK